MISYINGAFKSYDDCNIHISDLGLQRGYAVFDFFRADGDQIIGEDDYFDRLFGSIKEANLESDLSREELGNLCKSLQSKNRLKRSTFKVIVSGGTSTDLGTFQDKPSLIIIQNPFKPLPPEIYQNGANLITQEYQRQEPEIKTLNYFFSVRMHQRLKDFNALDILFHTDQIRETSRSNFFGVKNGKIHTPQEKILKGITRKNVLKLNSQEFDFQERDIFIDELYNFDEIFITGTSKFIVPVVMIEGKKIGDGTPGKITRRLMEAFPSWR